jgi:hypothetical protein
MATKYEKWLTEEGLKKVEAWARDGLTNEQIAHNMGITRKTLFVWQTRYPELAERLKKGKEVVDIEVENALLKRALGYEYTETMIEQSADGRKIRKTVKEVVPDVTAQIFWLKNRKPKEWRDKQDVNVNGSVPVVFSGADKLED